MYWFTLDVLQFHLSTRALAEMQFLFFLEKVSAGHTAVIPTSMCLHKQTSDLLPSSMIQIQQKVLHHNWSWCREATLAIKQTKKQTNDLLDSTRLWLISLNTYTTGNNIFYDSSIGGFCYKLKDWTEQKSELWCKTKFNTGFPFAVFVLNS